MNFTGENVSRWAVWLQVWEGIDFSYNQGFCLFSEGSWEVSWQGWKSWPCRLLEPVSLCGRNRCTLSTLLSNLVLTLSFLLWKPQGKLRNMVAFHNPGLFIGGSVYCCYKVDAIKSWEVARWLLISLSLLLWLSCYTRAISNCCFFTTNKWFSDLSHGSGLLLTPGPPLFFLALLLF